VQALHAAGEQPLLIWDAIFFQKMIWTLRLRKSRQKLLGRRDQDFRSLNLYLKGYIYEEEI